MKKTIWEQCADMWELPIEEVRAIEKKYYNYANSDECELWQTAKKIINQHEHRLQVEAEKQKQWEYDLSAYKEVSKWPEKWLENDRVTKNGGCYLLDGLTFYTDQSEHISKKTEAIRKGDTLLKMMLIVDDE